MMRSRTHDGYVQRLVLHKEIVGPVGESGSGGSPRREEASWEVWDALSCWVDAGCPPVLPPMPPPDPTGDTHSSMPVPAAARAALTAEAVRTGRSMSEIVRRLTWPEWVPTAPRVIYQQHRRLPEPVRRRRGR